MLKLGKLFTYPLSVRNVFIYPVRLRLTLSFCVTELFGFISRDSWRRKLKEVFDFDGSEGAYVTSGIKLIIWRF
jgi:hypothetical protein